MYAKRSGPRWAVWAVLLLVIISGGLLYAALTGKTRRPQVAAKESSPAASSTTTTQELVARHLDGVMVPVGEESARPRAVMVENHADGWPLSGLSRASVVIEAPVEGGIHRFMSLFDGHESVDAIGPIRSARPYFVDWAQGWDAEYFHVGGSPAALEQIASLNGRFANADEIRMGYAFWRSRDRWAPHNAYTKTALMDDVETRRGFATSSAVVAWHFEDAATGTERGDVKTIRIPFGGFYNVVWRFDKERGVYVRSQNGKAHTDADGSPVESENVIVIKTDARVLDDVGRLQLRTTGSGDATAYRNGKKFTVRWHRSAGEPIRFEGLDGGEYLLTRGRTWIEVTTDDKVFAGL